MFRRAAFDAVGGFDQERFGIAADLDMWTRLSIEWRIGLVHEYLMGYRHYTAQWSKQYERMRTEPEMFFAAMDRHLSRPGIRALVSARGVDVLSRVARARRGGACGERVRARRPPESGRAAQQLVRAAAASLVAPRAGRASARAPHARACGSGERHEHGTRAGSSISRASAGSRPAISRRRRRRPRIRSATARRMARTTPTPDAERAAGRARRSVAVDARQPSASISIRSRAISTATRSSIRSRASIATTRCCPWFRLKERLAERGVPIDTGRLSQPSGRSDREHGRRKHLRLVRRPRRRTSRCSSATTCCSTRSTCSRWWSSTR